MAVYGGENYTNFKGVNFKNTGFIRVQMDSGNAGTMSVKAGAEENREWILPDKSGAIGITGTFQVSVPVHAVATAGVYSTVVTVSGIRSEDGLVCTLQGALGTAGISLVGAVAGDGTITVYFGNTSGGTLNVLDRTVAYTAVR